jgi:hypothetical protein
LFDKANFWRAEFISAGANSAPPAPLALFTASFDTAMLVVAGTFMLLHPAVSTTALLPATASQNRKFVFIILLLLHHMSGKVLPSTKVVIGLHQASICAVPYMEKWA